MFVYDICVASDGVTVEGSIYDEPGLIDDGAVNFLLGRCSCTAAVLYCVDVVIVVSRTICGFLGLGALIKYVRWTAHDPKKFVETWWT